MQQIVNLVFFYNDLRLSNIFDLKDTVEIDGLGRFFTIIDEPQEKFLLFHKPIISNPQYTTKDFYKKVLSIAKNKNYRLVIYDNYEVINLEEFETPFKEKINIHDIAQLAEQIKYDKSNIFIYDCGDKRYYKKQHHLKNINFIKYNNVVRQHTKFKCISSDLLKQNPKVFPTLNVNCKSKWFCSFTNKTKSHRVIFQALMNQDPLWKEQNISFNNVNQSVELSYQWKHYLEHIDQNKVTAPHEPEFDHFAHSFYIGPSVKTFQESAICVVGESQDFPYNIFVTEKTTNPIVNCMPVIVYGQKYHMHILEELGIDIFRDLIGDFAYDSIEDMEQRVKGCANLCKQLMNKDIEYYKDWLKENKERLIKNAQFLISQVEKQGDEFGKFNYHFFRGFDPNLQDMI